MNSTHHHPTAEVAADQDWTATGDADCLLAALDPRGRLLRLNRKALCFFDLAPGPVGDLDPQGLLFTPPENGPDWRQLLTRAAAGSPCQAAPMELSLASGETAWLAWTFCLHAPGVILAQGREVTAARRAQATLSARLAMDLVVDSISQSLLAADHSGLQHSQAMALDLLARFVGYGQGFILELPAGQSARPVALWATPPQTGESLPLEWWEPQGPLRDLLAEQQMLDFPRHPTRAMVPEVAEALAAQGLGRLVAAPIIIDHTLRGCLGYQDPDPELGGADEDAVLLRSVAELLALAWQRAQAEEELSRSRERLRLLFRHAPVGILTCDADLGNLQANPVLLSILEYRPGPEDTDPSRFLETTLARVGLDHDLVHCVRGRRQWSGERRARLGAGFKHLRCQLAPLLLPDGEVFGVEMLVEDISELVEARHALEEQERYLADLVETMRAGLIVVDPRDHTIVEVNTQALEMIGATRSQVVGRVCHNFICPAAEGKCPVTDLKQEVDNSERFLRRLSGELVPVLKSVTTTQRKGQTYLVECFTDVSRLHGLLDEQRMDIGLAKHIMGLVGGPAPRHMPLDDLGEACCIGVVLPCQAEGGDHILVRTLPSGPNCPSGRTIMSVRDQSGHQVGCVLRSIYTDIWQQRLLLTNPFMPLEELVERLNLSLFKGGALQPDDFATAWFGDLHHHDGRLYYLSCGHPRFILLRQGEAYLMPPRRPGPGNNPPLSSLARARFSLDWVQLEPGDQVLVYTDGLLEAAAGGHQGLDAGWRFRAEELAALVEQLAEEHHHPPIGQLIPIILKEVGQLGGSALDMVAGNHTEDDVTLLGLEVESLAGVTTETWRPRDQGDLQVMMDRFFAAREAEWRERGFAKPQRLRICLEESVVNAWKHGCAQQPGCSIVVEHGWGNDFRLVVGDGGPGFLPHTLPDPRSRAHLGRESGRGLFLIRRHADQVRWDPQGNRLAMYFAAEPMSDFQGAMAMDFGPGVVYGIP